MNKKYNGFGRIDIIAVILIISIPFSTFSQMKLPSPNEVLSASSKKLNSINTIKYDSDRELNYSSENYRSTSSWTVYLDFGHSNPLIGFKFQVDDPTIKMIFNGTEKFELDKKTKTIKINHDPIKNDFKSLSFLYNSIVSIKNVLPILINDQTLIKSVIDTIINDKTYFAVKVNAGKRRIQNLGIEFDTMDTKYDIIYKIIIDKVNYLPYEVVQMNSLNRDYIKTTFLGIEINNNTPEKPSWYYSTFTDDYKESKEDNLRKLTSPNNYK